MTRGQATAIGFVAVVLWAMLALLTIATSPVPPLLLNAMTFGIGGSLGLVWAAATGNLRALARVPISALVLGTAGLFGYHFTYFTAFRVAPSAETGLMAYLWPLFIVLFSAILPGERLRRGAIAGAAVAFAGAAILVMGRPSHDAATPAGLALGLLCAIIWASYSVSSRLMANVPTSAVAVSCLATAVLSSLIHPFMEETIWPETASGWLAVFALGAGPVGLAFYVWDIGVKRGDLQFLGVLSYASPLLSTTALVIAGLAPATPRLAFAALLIAGGAAIAARTRRSPPSDDGGQLALSR